MAASSQPDQKAIVRELMGRRASLAPEQAAIVDELASRFGLNEPQIPGMERLGGTAPKAGHPPIVSMTGLGLRPTISKQQMADVYGGLGGGMESDRAQLRKAGGGFKRIAEGEFTGGAADILEGTLGAGGKGFGMFLAPMMLPVSGPAITAGLGTAGATIASRVAQYGGEYLGLTPDQARLFGDAVGLYAGGKALGRLRARPGDTGGPGTGRAKLPPLPDAVKAAVRFKFGPFSGPIIKLYESFSEPAPKVVAPPPVKFKPTTEPEAVPPPPVKFRPPAEEPPSKVVSPPGVKFKKPMAEPKPKVVRPPGVKFKRPEASGEPVPAPPVTFRRPSAEAGAEPEPPSQPQPPGHRKAGPLQASPRPEPNAVIDVATYAKDGVLFKHLRDAGLTKAELANPEFFTDADLSKLSQNAGYDPFTGKGLHRTPAQARMDLLARWNRFEENGRDLPFVEAVKKYGPRVGRGQ